MVFCDRLQQAGHPDCKGVRRMAAQTPALGCGRENLPLRGVCAEEMPLALGAAQRCLFKQHFHEFNATVIAYQQTLWNHEQGQLDR